MKIIPITLVVWLVTIPVFAQRINWQNMDLLQDGVFGISTERAYTELLAYKKAKTVIVAVLDVGVDTSHEDHKGVFWSNPRELIRRDKPRYDTLTVATASVRDRAGFLAYKSMLADYTDQVDSAKFNLQENVRTLAALDSVAKNVGGYLTSHPSYETLEKEIREYIDFYDHTLNYYLNFAYDPRYLVGDDYNNDHERLYGNADIVGPDPSHGTFISGIISAVRGNRIGIDGVADHVQIMVVRMGCDGDERDKDVANAIRYAVDNGAKVINMSFGKYYSWDKKCRAKAGGYVLGKRQSGINK
jgi:subtilisin family serine protease